MFSAFPPLFSVIFDVLSFKRSFLEVNSSLAVVFIALVAIILVVNCVDVRRYKIKADLTNRVIMLSEKFIEDFAAAWIAAWNSHDIVQILSHYEDDFEFSSPVLAKVLPASSGKLSGKTTAHAYWSKGLAARPDLFFEPLTILKGVNSAVIYYKGLGGKLCAEYFEFTDRGKVKSSHAHGA
jgi:hypothetical protein